jgi:hypothetical protein
MQYFAGKGFIFGLALGALLAAGVVVAQGPAPTTGGGVPQLTELEKVKIENIGLKNTIISLQKSLLQAQAQLVDKGGDAIKETQNMLVLDVQKAHPGYTLNGDGALVAIPAPKK